MRTVRSRKRVGFSTIQTIKNGLKDAGIGSFSMFLALFGELAHPEASRQIKDAIMTVAV
jgi:hypothetical protein